MKLMRRMHHVWSVAIMQSTVARKSELKHSLKFH